jgi:uncharacterized protein (TIGR03083 family)
MNTNQHQQTCNEIKTVAGSIAELVRSLPDTSVQIPGSSWSVGEAAAHLVTTQELYNEGLKGQSSPYGNGQITTFAAVNAQLLADSPERDGATLAAMLVDRTHSFLEQSATYSVQHQIHYHFGTMDLPTWTSYMLFHLLMHGWPIAKALGQPSPLKPAHTDLTVPFLKAVLPRVFNKEAARELRACLEVRLRGGRRFVVQFNDGSVTVEDVPTRQVDCYLSADPVVFFLVTAGLVSQWGPIAQGKLVAWGRKPWLALRFKTFFPNP